MAITVAPPTVCVSALPVWGWSRLLACDADSLQTSSLPFGRRPIFTSGHKVYQAAEHIYGSTFNPCLPGNISPHALQRSHHSFPRNALTLRHLSVIFYHQREISNPIGRSEVTIDKGAFSFFEGRIRLKTCQPAVWGRISRKEVRRQHPQAKYWSFRNHEAENFMMWLLRGKNWHEGGGREGGSDHIASPEYAGYKAIPGAI